MIMLLILLGQLHRSEGSDFVYRPFNHGTYCSPSTLIKTPTSLGELNEILAEATKFNLTVKALGSLHTMTDLICTDGIPISMKGFKSTKMNEDGTGTFGAGIEILEAMQFLERNGRTLMNVPTYAGITLGGALGTGAGGSSLRHPATISDVVVGVTSLLASGEVLEIKDPEELRHFKVHLGLLGILLDVTVETVPLNKMWIHNFRLPDSVLTSDDKNLLSWAQGYDFFQFWWFPSLKEVVISRGTQVELSERGNASTNFISNVNGLQELAFAASLELIQLTRSAFSARILESTMARFLHSKVIALPPIFTEDGTTLVNPAVGFNWRLQTNKCSFCGWESGAIKPTTNAVNFDLKDFSRVVKTLKEILGSSPVLLIYGLFFRFVKASDATMSTAHGRDSFIVEIISTERSDHLNTPKFGLDALQLMQQVLLSFEGARPHWSVNGLHYFTNEVIAKAIPESNRKTFIKAMKKYDPNGMFLNKFGRRSLGLSEEMDVDPAVKRCALQDYCICREDKDCGIGQACRTLSGYKVCRDRLSLLSIAQEAVSLEQLKGTLGVLNVLG